MCVIAL